MNSFIEYNIPEHFEEEDRVNDGRRTPSEVFDPLHQRFPFTLDPCTTRDNPLGLSSFFTEEDNSLRLSWEGHRVFCNPPCSHGSIIRWVEKAASEREAFTALLIPAGGLLSQALASR